MAHVQAGFRSGWLLLLAGAVGLLLTTLAAAADLSAEERKLKDHAAEHGDEALALIERVVNVPSATENLEGVRKVGQVFRDEFDRLGFRTRWAEMPKEMNRAGHLVAEHPGTRGKRLLLIGHLDTVLEGRPFQRAGARVKGNGTLDMKGGDVVLLYALKALEHVGALEGRQVIVVLTGDEEDTGLPIARSRADLREAAARSDVALAFEAQVDDTATVARRGVSSWSLRVRGIIGHSSGILRETHGAGANYELARILDAFRTELSGEKNLTINPSLILGGTKTTHDAEASRGTAEGKSNVIAGEAVAEGDLRFISPEQLERAKARMSAIAAKNLPRASATLSFEDEYPAMAPRDGNFEVLRMLDRVSQDLGLGPVKALDPGLRGAGDISFVADQVIGLDGLGPRGEHSHAPEEELEVDSLVPQIQRAAVLMYRLTR